MKRTDESGRDRPRVQVPLDECALARAARVIGDVWTLLILREVLCGATRFDAMQAELGISRAVLANRLRRAVDQGLLDRRPVPVPGQRTRHGYEMTDKGRALLPAMVALRAWSDAHVVGTPSRLQMHTREGGRVRVRLVDDADRDVDPGDIVVSAAEP